MSAEALRKEEVKRRYVAARKAGLTGEQITRMANVSMQAALERAYGFDARTARRIAFARWLRVKGRLERS